jgi:hypothetical protein
MTVSGSRAPAFFVMPMSEVNKCTTSKRTPDDYSTALLGDAGKSGIMWLQAPVATFEVEVAAAAAVSVIGRSAAHTLLVILRCEIRLLSLEISYGTMTTR